MLCSHPFAFRGSFLSAVTSVILVWKYLFCRSESFVLIRVQTTNYWDLVTLVCEFWVYLAMWAAVSMLYDVAAFFFFCLARSSCYLQELTLVSHGSFCCVFIFYCLRDSRLPVLTHGKLATTVFGFRFEVQISVRDSQNRGELLAVCYEIDIVCIGKLITLSRVVLCWTFIRPSRPAYVVSRDLAHTVNNLSKQQSLWIETQKKIGSGWFFSGKLKQTFTLTYTKPNVMWAESGSAVVKMCIFFSCPASEGV